MVVIDPPSSTGFPAAFGVRWALGFFAVPEGDSAAVAVSSLLAGSSEFGSMDGLAPTTSVGRAGDDADRCSGIAEVPGSAASVEVFSGALVALAVSVITQLSLLTSNACSVKFWNAKPNFGKKLPDLAQGSILGALK